MSLFKIGHKITLKNPIITHPVHFFPQYPVYMDYYKGPSRYLKGGMTCPVSGGSAAVLSHGIALLSHGIDVVVEFDGLHAAVGSNHLFIEIAKDLLHLAHRCGGLHLEGDLADVQVLHPGHKGRYGA